MERITLWCGPSLPFQISVFTPIQRHLVFGGPWTLKALYPARFTEFPKCERVAHRVNQKQVYRRTCIDERKIALLRFCVPVDGCSHMSNERPALIDARAQICGFAFSFSVDSPLPALQKLGVVCWVQSDKWANFIVWQRKPSYQGKLLGIGEYLCNLNCWIREWHQFYSGTHKFLRKISSFWKNSKWSVEGMTFSF